MTSVARQQPAGPGSRSRTGEPAAACAGRPSTVDRAEETAAERSDEELIAGSRRGSAEDFAGLVDRHAPAVFNYLRRFVGNPHDAEDLTQDTFLKAWRGMARFQTTRAFIPWLFTIARRTALNHFRARRPHEEFTEQTLAAPAGEVPDRVTEQADLANSIWRHARRLKPRQREALWLHYGEGLDVEEVARVMRTTRICVRVLLHRGRNELRRRLEGTGEFTPSGSGAAAVDWSFSP
ncbi:MAG: sigma-70 family RNA polymerase sigma factor [Verrucomicrobiae bacterium]|nr:sigma-70 family RNA polymerase sigma factor [Verrucomicrobiae bacterium]